MALFKNAQKSLPPLIKGKQALFFTSGSFACDHFQFYNIHVGLAFCIGSSAAKIRLGLYYVYSRLGLLTSPGAGNSEECVAYISQNVHPPRLTHFEVR